ncbi:pyruvate dehydrogenase complex dihydrolipoamide acetyltransferase [Sphingobacteriaceae bacterium]|nr:pyruvate dehydrogenase complex dihydrolipoamide acetyltransferase [Sphingobacteriaceae bacterium]
MAEVVKMPKLSDTMTDGVIAKWHKKVGDKVKSGELLADIETDKATMEFESFQDGVLLHIGVQEKQAVPVDSIIAILGKEGEDISGLLDGGSGESKQSDNKQEVKKESTSKESVTSSVAEKDEKKSESSAPKALPAGVEVVRMPKLSDTMTEGVLAKWHKKVGDKVKSGELLADIETDKATMEFESFQDGVLIYQGIEEGKATPVDSIIGILGKGDEDVKAILASVQSGGGSSKASSESAEKKETPEKKEASEEKDSDAKKTDAASGAVGKDEETHTSADGRIKASPLAKALAKEKGIDLGKVKGTAENGRITKADIENYKPAAASASGAKTATSSAPLGKEEFRDEPASQMRKTIARRLLESTQNTPVFYLNIEVDMDNAMAARNVINAIPDTKVSFNDLVIKACAAALRKHPQVNTSWMGDKVRFNSHIHIGMAVAVEDGLLVPVIRFADQKSLSQISAEAKDFGKRAKDKKLQPAEWEGNTFTVSNLGMFGIESFTSIINAPASCILSVGAIRQVPVVKNNMVVPGNTMMLSLACDHRTVDGATGAQFLQTLKIFIENPVTMIV